MYAPSTVSAHYYQQKVNVSQANHLLAYPISVKTSQKHIVIGVQVLGKKKTSPTTTHHPSLCPPPDTAPSPSLLPACPLLVLASNPQDAYFKADVFVCGYTYVSDPTKWRCSNGPVPDDSWLTADFDDSAWDPATVAVSTTDRSIDIRRRNLRCCWPSQHAFLSPNLIPPHRPSW